MEGDRGGGSRCAGVDVYSAAVRMESRAVTAETPIQLRTLSAKNHRRQ